MPYGEKTEAELLEFADRIFNFFLSKNAKAVVMACNTTSSVIYDKVKDKYNIKIYPIIQSTANIFAQMPIKTIGVFATPATINSNVYKKEIQKYNPNMEVIQIACPEWVKIVEENRINDSQSLNKIKEKLEEMVKFSPDKIVLGCTHYPYLKNILSQFDAKTEFVDPAVFFAEFIKNDLIKNKMNQKAAGIEEVYVSASPEKFQESAKMFYELNKLPQLALTD